MDQLKAEKGAVISLRTLREVEAAIEEYARDEHRSMSQMIEVLLREAIVARRNRANQPPAQVNAPPAPHIIAQIRTLTDKRAPRPSRKGKQ